MPDRREALAAVLAEQSPDDEDLRDWLTDRTEFVADALAAAGIHLCTEGQAVVDGEVVTLGAEMTTYSAPDGGEVVQEFAFITETDWLDDDTDPTPLRRQRWVCVSDEVGTYYPPAVTLCPMCGGEGDRWSDEDHCHLTCETCHGTGEHPLSGAGFVVEEASDERR